MLSSLSRPKPSHQKMATLSKTNGTLLLKWLVAFCVLDSVAASEFSAITSPNPSPEPLTCGCAAEIELMRTQILSESKATCENKLEAVREFVGMTPPSAPPSPPLPPPCALGPWSEEQTSEDQYFISGRMVALI